MTVPLFVDAPNVATLRVSIVTVAPDSTRTIPALPLAELFARCMMPRSPMPPFRNVTSAVPPSKPQLEDVATVGVPIVAVPVVRHRIETEFTACAALDTRARPAKASITATIRFIFELRGASLPNSLEDPDSPQFTGGAPVPERQEPRRLAPTGLFRASREIRVC